MPEASSQDSAPVSKHRLGRNTSGLARPSQVFASSPALEQQKWQTYFTSCCVWITSRAFSRFSAPSSSAGNSGRAGSWLPLTALSSASSAYARRNSASFPRISSASLSTPATLSLGASVPPTMPPNRTPRRAQTHGPHAGPSRRRTGRRRPRFRRITIARFLQNERAGATAIPRWSARSETK
jgi:hypothetical protein